MSLSSGNVSPTNLIRAPIRRPPSFAQGGGVDLIPTLLKVVGVSDSPLVRYPDPYPYLIQSPFEDVVQSGDEGGALSEAATSGGRGWSRR